MRNAVIPPDFLEAIAHDHHLSSAEQEVLSRAMDGKPTVAIAQELGISGDAVRKRLSEVYQKFHISGRGPVKLTKLQQLLVSRYQALAQNRNQQPASVPEQSSAPAASDAPEFIQSAPVYDWGEAPDSSVFYGREAELSQLRQWLIQDQCRLVAVLGMAGIGKTALAVKLARQIQDEFESVLWLSLRHAPSLQDLLNQITPVLTNAPSTSHNGKSLSDSLEFQMSALIHYFRSHRCLLVLDGVESILQSGRLAGVYRDGYADYGELFKRVGQEPHRSCVIVTSQEKPSEIALLEGETSPVRSLKIDGLSESDAKHLLTEKGLTGDTQKWTDLIRGYRGNPFMLKMVATTIREVFDGNVTSFLKTTLFTHDISDYIEDILERVSDVENEILHEIAQKQQSMSMDELMNTLPTSSPQDLIRALQSLKQRSLLETSDGRFNLPPTVMNVISQTIDS
ncbi:MAG: NB-ARC domain-containing protein [Elainellaceae cyanobacterium]